MCCFFIYVSQKPNEPHNHTQFDLKVSCSLYFELCYFNVIDVNLQLTPSWISIGNVQELYGWEQTKAFTKYYYIKCTLIILFGLVLLQNAICLGWIKTSCYCTDISTNVYTTVHSNIYFSMLPHTWEFFFTIAQHTCRSLSVMQWSVLSAETFSALVIVAFISREMQRCTSCLRFAASVSQMASQSSNTRQCGGYTETRDVQSDSDRKDENRIRHVVPGDEFDVLDSN